MEGIKNRRFYKAIALALSIVIILTTLCGCYKSNFRSKYRSGDGSFSDIVYKMPDFERFNSLCDSIDKDKNNPFMAISINNKFIEIFDIYNDMLAMMGVTNLYTYIDVTNESYINDYQTLADELNEAGHRIYKIVEDLKSASGGYIVRTNNNLDNIMLSLSEYSDKDKNEELTDIRNDYYSAKSEYMRISSTEFTIDANKYEFLYVIPDAAKNLTDNGDGTYSWLITEKDIDALFDAGYIDEQIADEMYRDINVQKREIFGEILIKLIETGKNISYKSKGIDFRDYRFMYYERDYSPKDIESLIDTVKECVVPLIPLLSEKIDFDNVNEADATAAEIYENSLISIAETILSGVDTSFVSYIKELVSKGRLNYKYSPVKMDISFSEILPVYDIPFIFIQPAETASFYDINSFIHEFGHYYHYVKCPSFSESNDIDSMEVMSLSLELMATKNYGALFESRNICESMYNYELYWLLYSLLESFMTYEFENRIYSEKALTPEKISEIYYECLCEYGFTTNDNSKNEALKDAWTGIYHIFCEPFYTLSYGISTLTAIQVFFSDNPIKIYNDFCTNSVYYSIRDNAILCGLCDPISTEYVKDLIEKYTESFY